MHEPETMRTCFEDFYAAEAPHDVFSVVIARNAIERSERLERRDGGDFREVAAMQNYVGTLGTQMFQEDRHPAREARDVRIGDDGYSHGSRIETLEGASKPLEFARAFRNIHRFIGDSLG